MTDYGLSREIPLTDPRQVLWAKQRAERGFDDTELWNLDVTIAEFITPRLKAYAAKVQGVPGTLKEEEWQQMLNLMVQTFEEYSEAECHDKTMKGKKGFKLFRKYFSHLWQ